METHFDSVHAGSTDLARAAACTCDNQIACALGFCAARHLSLCVMRLQLAFNFDLQLAHGRAPTSKKMVFRNNLLVCLIPHLHVCEIPLHTLLTRCRDVHTFVEAQVSISGNFVFQTLVVVSVCSQLPMNILSSKDSPSA